MSKVKKTDIFQARRRIATEPDTNKYYLLVSNRFMAAKYFAIVLLIVFFAFMMIRFEEDITYTNLMYLIRDFNTAEDIKTTGFTAIEYDEQENMSFALYKGELSVIGNRTLKMYNVRGEETCSYEPGYSDPALVSSDKYLLAYNVGTPSYSVFNSIARVSSDEAPGDIETAHMNNRGEYILVCRSTDTKYVVCTYDSSFRPIAKYYKNRYVTASAIGEKGQVVIASFSSDGAAFDCEVELYFDGSENPDSVYTATGVFPIRCGVFKNGGFYVICTDRVMFFDKNGTLVDSVDSTLEYTSFAASEDRLAVSFNNDSLGNNSTVFVFDTEGKLLYNNVIDGSVSSISLTGDGVCALASSKVYLFDDSGEVLEIKAPSGDAVLIPYGDSAVLCAKDGALGVRFADNSSEDTESSVGTDTDAELLGGQ